MEAVGLFFVLLSAWWQLFVEEPVGGELPYAYFVTLNEVVLYVWQALGAPDPKQFVADNNQHFWEAREMVKRDAFHTEELAIVRGVLFIFGSALVLLAKWFAPSSGSTDQPVTSHVSSRPRRRPSLPAHARRRRP